MLTSHKVDKECHGAVLSLLSLPSMYVPIRFIINVKIVTCCNVVVFFKGNHMFKCDYSFHIIYVM